jgi:superfamily II DNA or RNA helicase
MKIQKRKYQIDATDAAYNAQRKVFVVSPGGSGKTIMIALLVKKARAEKKRVLVVSHRREIVTQTRTVLRALGEEPAILLGSDSTDINGSKTIIASVATLSSRGFPTSDTLIIDEAHRALAPTYRKLVQYFDEKGKRVIGFSATPTRIDGQALSNVFDHMIEAAKPSQLIGKYIIAPTVYSGDPRYLPDVAQLKGTKEYQVKDLTSEVMKQGLLGNLVTNVKSRLGNRQGILFAVSIIHSKECQRRLRRAGYKVAHVDSEMPEHERDDIIERFKRGEFQILCNCMLLNEGWDMPECDAVIMCRPTRSLSLYLQQCARCMRPGGKFEPVIIDMSWNFAKFLRPEDDRDWSLDGGGLIPDRSAPGMKVCHNEVEEGETGEMVECGVVNAPDAEVCKRCGGDLKRHRILIPGERGKRHLKRMTAQRIKEIEKWAAANGKSPAWAKKVIQQEKTWLQQ